MRSFCLVTIGLVAISAVYALQLPFRELISQEGYNHLPLPPDYRDHNEFTIGRLMYPNGTSGRGGGRGNWEQGGTWWSNDYPKGDRAFAAILRRLTRVDVRSVEQPINLNDGDDVYNWPWLYAAQLNQGSLTDSMTAKLREYLARGGFLYLDDIWGDNAVGLVQATLGRVLPGAVVEDIPDSDPIFHTLYDLKDRFMVANYRELTGAGRPFHTNGPGMTEAHWRGIRDSKGRVIVAIVINSDIGDSWEHADHPEYPEKYSNLGMRVSTNYAVYSMSH